MRSPGSTSGAFGSRRSPRRLPPPIAATPRTGPPTCPRRSRTAASAGPARGVKCLHAHYAFHLAGGVDPVGAWVAEQRRADPRRGAAGSRGRDRPGDELDPAARGRAARPKRAAIPTELARDMVITRLGQGVDRTGRLDPDALASHGRRPRSVLPAGARACTPDRIRVAATSAVRDAANRDVFAARGPRHAGSELEVISGEREAGLSFLGGTHGLDPVHGAAAVPACSTSAVVRPSSSSDAEPGRAPSARSRRRWGASA